MLVSSARIVLTNAGMVSLCIMREQQGLVSNVLHISRSIASQIPDLPEAHTIEILLELLSPGYPGVLTGTLPAYIWNSTKASLVFSMIVAGVDGRRGWQV